MSRWSKIYQTEIDKAGGYQLYFKRKVDQYRPLLNHILVHSPPGARILEAGCGTAVLSTYLSSLGFNVVAFDRDKDMLALAEKLAELYPKKPDFTQGDLLEIDFPDRYFEVAFSHGTLEHFSNDKILALVNKQLVISKMVIVSIPSDYYGNKDRMYGDERFLSREEWEGILARTGGTIVERFSYGFAGPLDYLRYAWGRSAPLLGFVIEKQKSGKVLTSPLLSWSLHPLYQNFLLSVTDDTLQHIADHRAEQELADWRFVRNPAAGLVKNHGAAETESPLLAASEVSNGD